LDIAYVHSYSQTDYTLFYKWGGVLAGADGTLLFWVWLIALSLFIQEIFEYRKEKRHRNKNNDLSFADDKTLFVLVRLIVSIVIISFLYLIISIDLFGPTDSRSLLAYPNGYGLHANLHTPLMIAHPPMEFAGYAFLTIPMAAGLAYLITRKGKWTNISLQWGRWAWFFYLLGIGIGGLWAYIVLGWGGFWAWDPIETVNLIPFIFLTAFVHGQLFDHKRKLFRNIAILLAIISLLTSFLATFVTRSGLWISVHDFAEVNEKEAGIRLIKIIEVVESAEFFIIGMFLMLTITAILFTFYIMKPYIRKGNNGQRILPIIPSLFIGFMLILSIYIIYDVISFIETAFYVTSMLNLENSLDGSIFIFIMLLTIPVFWMYYASDSNPWQDFKTSEKKFKDYINDKNILTFALILLIIGAGITTYLLLASVNGASREVYDSQAPIIVLPMVIVLSIYMVWKKIGRKNVLYFASAMIASSIIGYLIYPDNTIISATFPLLIIALLASLYKIFKSALSTSNSNKNLNAAGILLISSGIIGMLMWGAPPSTVTFFSYYFRPDFAIALIMFILATLAVVGGIFTIQRVYFQWVVFGGIAGIISMGYYIGMGLAIFAMVLIIMSKKEFIYDSINTTKKAVSKKLIYSIRLVWTHIIHLAFIIFVIGYLLSTYMAVETQTDDVSSNQFFDMDLNEPLEFDGYEFKFVKSEGIITPENNDIEMMYVFIEVYQDGQLLTVANPYMKWAEHMNHYHQFVYVENIIIKDFYFIVRGFFEPSQGWIVSMGEPGV
jgi:cytochrome c-type biogenesis protein CcmF